MSAIDASAIRILVVRQPWAWAIAAGLKRYENRSWEPGKVNGVPWRGWILILAGASLKGEQDARLRMGSLVPPVIPPPDLVRGKIVCAVRLHDVIREDSRRRDAWCEPGQKWWELRDLLRFPTPVHCRGQQGLFAPSETILAEVFDQVTKHAERCRRASS